MADTQDADTPKVGGNHAANPIEYLKLDWDTMSQVEDITDKINELIDRVNELGLKDD